MTAYLVVSSLLYLFVMFSAWLSMRDEFPDVTAAKLVMHTAGVMFAWGSVLAIVSVSS